jgi:hypothetical protein
VKVRLRNQQCVRIPNPVSERPELIRAAHRRGLAGLAFGSVAKIIEILEVHYVETTEMAYHRFAGAL